MPNVLRKAPNHPTTAGPVSAESSITSTKGWGRYHERKSRYRRLHVEPALEPTSSWGALTLMSNRVAAIAPKSSIEIPPMPPTKTNFLQSSAQGARQ